MHCARDIACNRESQCKLPACRQSQYANLDLRNANRRTATPLPCDLQAGPPPELLAHACVRSEMSSCSRSLKILSLKDLAALLVPGALLFAALYLFRHPSPQPVRSIIELPRPVSDLTGRGMTDSLCSDRECTQYLTKRDKHQLETCELKLRQLDVKPFRGSSCRFRNGTGKIAVALASFPGSGNTWLRSLLEKATGVCTGSTTCDVSLRASGFIGEFADSSSLLVVKTHKLIPRWAKNIHHYEEERFNKAVVLVRNPFHALVADWHRRVANGLMSGTVNVHSHVAQAGPEWFGEPLFNASQSDRVFMVYPSTLSAGHNPLWEKYVKARSHLWSDVIEHWILEAEPERVLVVLYEDLVNDTSRELEHILNFLSHPYSHHSVQEAISSDAGLFHRHHTSSLKHFTEKQWKSISEVLSDTISAIGKSNYRGKLKLQQYKHKHL